MSNGEKPFHIFSRMLCSKELYFSHLTCSFSYSNIIRMEAYESHTCGKKMKKQNLKSDSQNERDSDREFVRASLIFLMLQYFRVRSTMTVLVTFLSFLGQTTQHPKLRKESLISLQFLEVHNLWLLGKVALH